MKTKLLLSVFLIFSIIAYSQETTSVSLGQTFRDYIMKQSNASNNSIAPNITALKTELVTEADGSPYFFDKWVSGKIFLKNNVALPEPGKLLNFDKMTNMLVIKLSGDNSKILNVDMKDIDRFILENDDKTYSFTRDPNDSTLFILELYTDNDYILYKKIAVKFVKADYENKGLYQTGYKYDRYVDENIYYLKPKNGEFILIHSTKKELKKVREAYPQAKQALELITVTSS